MTLQRHLQVIRCSSGSSPLHLHNLLHLHLCSSSTDSKHPEVLVLSFFGFSFCPCLPSHPTPFPLVPSLSSSRPCPWRRSGRWRYERLLERQPMVEELLTGSEDGEAGRVCTCAAGVHACVYLRSHVHTFQPSPRPTGSLNQNLSVFSSHVLLFLFGSLHTRVHMYVNISCMGSHDSHVINQIFRDLFPLM